MPRPKTRKERTLFIAWIIELVKKHGHATTNEVAAMFGLHRNTAERYIRAAVEQGGIIRHGRCGVFRDQRAIIDFDLKRYTYRGEAA